MGGSYSGSHRYELRFGSASILLALDDSEQDARTPLNECPYRISPGTAIYQIRLSQVSFRFLARAGGLRPCSPTLSYGTLREQGVGFYC